MLVRLLALAELLASPTHKLEIAARNERDDGQIAPSVGPDVACRDTLSTTSTEE